MKLFRMMGRSIRNAFKSVIRNFSLSMASISCITITLIIVAITLLLSYNLNNFTKLIKEELTIVIFLDRDISDEKITALKNEISAINNVSSYTFLSKNETKEKMMETDEILKNIMSKYSDDDNPLQDSFVVYIKEIDQITKTAQNLDDLDGVDIVKYGEDTAKKITDTFRIVEKASYITAGALILVIAFLITNTIKLTIFSRRKEIEIMRLVGASNATINLPFVFEGLFIGIIGAIIPVAIATYGYTLVYNLTSGKVFLSFIKLVNPSPLIYIVSGILLAIAMLVGVIGSTRAVRKYLKI